MIQNRILNESGRRDRLKGLPQAFKLRVQLESKGKGSRGGLRTVYVDIVEDRVIFLLHVYYKGESENLDARAEKMIRLSIDCIKEESK